MIIVMSPGATPEQIKEVEDTIKELGYTPHEIEGIERKVIGAVGTSAAKTGSNPLIRWRGLKASFPS